MAALSPNDTLVSSPLIPNDNLESVLTAQTNSATAQTFATPAPPDAKRHILNEPMKKPGSTPEYLCGRDRERISQVTLRCTPVADYREQYA